MPPPDRVALLVHYAAMMEEVPVGLLLLDWDLQPVWFNAEAARASAVWNHGERGAEALRARSAFRLPIPLADACRALRATWPDGVAAGQPQVVSDHARGLHARIRLHAPAGGQPPAFHLNSTTAGPAATANAPFHPEPWPCWPGSPNANAKWRCAYARVCAPRKSPPSCGAAR